MRVSLFFALALYCIAAAIPPSVFLFDPDAPTFHPAVEGEAIVYDYSRTIKADALISYAVVIRQAGNISPVCEGRGGPFIYRQTRDHMGKVVSLPATPNTLGYWAGNPDCDTLPAGTYSVSTTWTIERPLRAFLRKPFGGENAPEWVTALATAVGWLLPSKHVTRTSPAFTVREATTDDTTYP